MTNQTMSQLKKQAENGLVWFKNQWVSAKKIASDGCTGVPDLGLTDCCDQHDADYTIGSGISRFKGDLRLTGCVIKKGHAQKKPGRKLFYYALAPLFFIGVRLFGWRHYQKVNNNNG